MSHPRDLQTTNRQQIPDKDDVNTLDRMYQLANAYQKLGRLQDAEMLRLQALLACKRMLNGMHLETIYRVVLLAHKLLEEGLLEEAGTLELEALSACQRVLGHEHVETIIVMENLAIIYHKQGRLEEAEPLHLEAISIRKHILSIDHVDRFHSMCILANAYYKYNRLEEAEALYLQLRDLGDVKDPKVDGRMPKLASVYGAQGEVRIWEQAHLHLISIRKHRLGDEHVDTLRSVHELATRYTVQAEDRADDADYFYQEAIRLLRQVMAIRKHVLGDEHADTLD
ncbi:hypothetical protein FRC07_010143, partial [Ceratobasidium sp. 392]